MSAHPRALAAPSIWRSRSAQSAALPALRPNGSSRSRSAQCGALAALRPGALPALKRSHSASAFIGALSRRPGALAAPKRYHGASAVVGALSQRVSGALTAPPEPKNPISPQRQTPTHSLNIPEKKTARPASAGTASSCDRLSCAVTGGKRGRAQTLLLNPSQPKPPHDEQTQTPSEKAPKELPWVRSGVWTCPRDREPQTQHPFKQDQANRNPDTPKPAEPKPRNYHLAPSPCSRPKKMYEQGFFQL